ncbi:hypothetical protein [Psychrobacter aquimaris]|uniref:hypothetical protein n=1 Tax=Psychrobacter aquimaris TaxID=292733 RepID=UPI003FD2FBF4
MEVICVDFSISGLSNVVSFLGDIATILGVYVAWHIYKGWDKQKQREVIAIDSGIVISEMLSLREEIMRFRSVNPRDQSVIDYMTTKRDFIERLLKTIAMIDENVIYKPYILSMQKLINKLSDSSYPDDSECLLAFGRETNALVSKLKDLKLYK